MVHPVRAFRERERISLKGLADLIAAEGIDRPSEAKLSRIENGQKCPVQLLPVLEKVSGIPAKELRPDLAKMFGGQR